MLGNCWSSVEDGGPTITQHWVNASCLLGSYNNDTQHNTMIIDHMGDV